MFGLNVETRGGDRWNSQKKMRQGECRVDQIKMKRLGSTTSTTVHHRTKQTQSGQTAGFGNRRRGHTRIDRSEGGQIDGGIDIETARGHLDTIGIEHTDPFVGGSKVDRDGLKEAASTGIPENAERVKLSIEQNVCSAQRRCVEGRIIPDRVGHTDRVKDGAEAGSVDSAIVQQIEIVTDRNRRSLGEENGERRVFQIGSRDDRQTIGVKRSGDGAETIDRATKTIVLQRDDLEIEHRSGHSAAQSKVASAGSVPAGLGSNSLRN